MCIPPVQLKRSSAVPLGCHAQAKIKIADWTSRIPRDIPLRTPPNVNGPKVMAMQIVQEKQLKLLVAKTTGVVVAEIVLPGWS